MSDFTLPPSTPAKRLGPSTGNSRNHQKSIPPPPVPELPQTELAQLESHWGYWLYTLFPSFVNKPMGGFHEEFWDWAWSIQPDIRPQPHIEIWSRGFGKSTNAELFAISLGARKLRTYGLYVGESQDRADDHVANIAAMLESKQFAGWYPNMANRAISRYGQSKGWRRNRLHTASGFVVDALGLDVASRGLKVDEKRPDFLIFDDCDSDTDTTELINRKISTLTRRILPALHPHAAIVGIQNLVHADSIFSRIVGNVAEFLADAHISGPIPAIQDLQYETRVGESGRPRVVITAGTPTWPPMSIEKCQEQIDTIGITAFLSELQHIIPEATGGMFDSVTFRRCTRDELPPLDKTVCWVDPAVTESDSSDSCGIQIDGLSRDGTLYRLWSWEQRSLPREAIKKALRMAKEYGAIYVGVETNQGGELWTGVFHEVRRELGPAYMHITMRSVKAGTSTGNKVHRAATMLASYEKGEVVHVEGTHDVLEAALIRFPRSKPYDLVDAATWGHHDLKRLSRRGQVSSAVGAAMPDGGRGSSGGGGAVIPRRTNTLRLVN